MRTLKKNKKGFSLIELIVVMGIMAILVLIAVPKFLGYTKDAKITAMQTDAKVLSDAALQYGINNNDDWPESVDVVALTTEAENAIKEITDLTDLTTLELKALDKDALNIYVKNISNDYEDYYLVTADGSEFQGEIFYNGVLSGTKEDVNGDKAQFNGIHEVPVTAVVTP